MKVILFTILLFFWKLYAKLHFIVLDSIHCNLTEKLDALVISFQPRDNKINEKIDFKLKEVNFGTRKVFPRESEIVTGYFKSEVTYATIEASTYINGIPIKYTIASSFIFKTQLTVNFGPIYLNFIMRFPEDDALNHFEENAIMLDQFFTEKYPVRILKKFTFPQDLYGEKIRLNINKKLNFYIDTTNISGNDLKIPLFSNSEIDVSYFNRKITTTNSDFSNYNFQKCDNNFCIEFQNFTYKPHKISVPYHLIVHQGTHDNSVLQILLNLCFSLNAEDDCGSLFYSGRLSRTLTGRIPSNINITYDNNLLAESKKIKAQIIIRNFTNFQILFFIPKIKFIEIPIEIVDNHFNFMLFYGSDNFLSFKSKISKNDFISVSNYALSNEFKKYSICDYADDYDCQKFQKIEGTKFSGYENIVSKLEDRIESGNKYEFVNFQPTPDSSRLKSLTLLKVGNEKRKLLIIILKKKNSAPITHREYKEFDCSKVDLYNKTRKKYMFSIIFFAVISVQFITVLIFFLRYFYLKYGKIYPKSSITYTSEKYLNF